MTFEMSEEDFEKDHAKKLIDGFMSGEFAKDMNESGQKHGIKNVQVKCEIYDLEA